MPKTPCCCNVLVHNIKSILLITAIYLTTAPAAYAGAAETYHPKNAAQQPIPYPKTDYPLQTTILDTQQLHQFQTDPNFQYDRERTPKNNFIERWLAYIFEKIANIFNAFSPITSKRTFWDIVTYLLVGIAIALAVSKLLHADLSRIFFRRSKKAGALPYETISEDIHSLDFDNEIKQYIAQKQYRKAVRLYYLQSLKQLADKQLIQWQPHKTNRQYRQELKNTRLQEPFTQLTRLFDYIWYGEFPVDDLIFDQAQRQFNAFQQIVK